MQIALPDCRPLIRKAIELAGGSQYALVRAAQKKRRRLSQQRISQILSGDTIGPEAAITIHMATDGLVPASAFRPDLWRRAEDVPIPIIKNGRGLARKRVNGAKR